METVEDVLVATADAVSAARPGARRETTETYIERLRSLEDIALGHRGVDKAYAIQAGREIRVMVQPSEVDDRIAAKLAYDISKQIETDLEYPGQIKVTVIRESRVSEVRTRLRGMEGPYRDLGSGFARLTGVEGARRRPSRITHVEDALFELLRNARDAGARRIYVASTLKDRRYRTLTVIDDGHGIPDSHRDLILRARRDHPPPEPHHEPGRPIIPPRRWPLPLPHKARSLSTRILSASSPTAIQVNLRHQDPPRTRPPVHLPTLQNQPQGHPATLRPGNECPP